MLDIYNAMELKLFL